MAEPFDDIVTQRPEPRAAWAQRLLERLPPVLAQGHYRLRPGAVVGICLLAALAVLGGGLLLVRGQAHPVTLSAPESGADSYATQRPSTAGVLSPAPAAAGAIEVDVVGKVRAHGVYHLPVGARVTDALAAAGGALPGVDLTSLDLASRVTDGDQIRVGLAAPANAAGASSVVPGGGGAAAGAVASIGPESPLDLNAANAAQLDALPGVGPTTAAKILAWRAAHGPFTSVSGLGQIPGFSAKRLATLTPLLRA